MNIAVIGLGNMGLPMADNLLRAGHSVAGYDLVAENRARHAANGGRVATSVADAVGDADVVLTMLPAGQHVEAVCMGQGGVFDAVKGRSPLLIDSSTIDVDTVRKLAAEARIAGLDLLDAPVSGGVGGATAGTLTFMVGGTAAGFARAEPVLKAMGKAIIHAGASGAGQAAKACNNMMLAINMIGVAEGFLLADRLGLDRQKLFDIASTATSQSWAMTSYCPAPGPVPAAPSNRDYAPGFATALMLKDLTLAQGAAASAGSPTPLGAHARRIYAAMAEQGEAGQDFSVVFRWLATKPRDEAV
ncbi:MAG: 3-hydroxyisobutyrate dehydrogenase [Rhodospirillales bacterium]|nr:3-hydroxyisobutyrate dehydrogenase [Rhodospirillales bacterium]